MKVLIVGGTGLAGGVAAGVLEQRGHSVTLMSRQAPASSVLQHYPHLIGDYISDPCDDGRLDGFDALIFAAAADIRHVPQDGSESPDDFYTRVHRESVPKFFEAARAAGIGRCAYLGSFYPQVAPQRVAVCPYVSARKDSDDAVRALSAPGFNVCSVNAPFILGHLPGVPLPHLGALVTYARGQLEGVPVFAPRGGTNHMSALSVAEALLGALQRGESGVPYLVGDENYSWKEYLELWFAAAGNPQQLEVSDDDHPLLPNVIMFAGPGATVSYEPDAAETKLLGYRRGQIAALIPELVAAFS